VTFIYYIDTDIYRRIRLFSQGDYLAISFEFSDAFHNRSSALNGVRHTTATQRRPFVIDCR
jgi:hypothetical protein